MTAIELARIKPGDLKHDVVLVKRRACILRISQGLLNRIIGVAFPEEAKLSQAERLNRWLLYRKYLKDENLYLPRKYVAKRLTNRINEVQSTRISIIPVAASHDCPVRNDSPLQPDLNQTDTVSEKSILFDRVREIIESSSIDKTNQKRKSKVATVRNQ
jgi:hypothetical protein